MNTEQKCLLILAGSHAEFIDFCKENKLKPDEAIYATEHSALGKHPDNTILVKYGTWYLRDDKWIDKLTVEFSHDH